MDGNDKEAPIEPDSGDGAEGHVSAAGLIEKFGGIRPMAAKLELAVSTVQGWKQRDAIPVQRLAAIRAAAARHGISLDDIAMAPAPIKPKAETKAAPRAASVIPSHTPRKQAPNPPPHLLPLGLAVAACLLATVALGLTLWRSGLVGEDGRLAALVTRLTALESTPAPEPDQRLIQRIAELEQRLSEAMAAPARTGPPDPRLEQMAAEAEVAHARVVALEERLARLAEAPPPAEADAAMAALQSEVEALRGQVAELSQAEAPAEGRMARALALALAVGQLRAAVADGRPYVNELAAIAAFGLDDPTLVEALDSLAPFAASRVPGRASLRADFAAVARRSVLAQRAADDEDWVDRLLTRVSALVSVREIGPDVQGADAEAVMARAEVRLAVSDLAGAVRELESLTGPSAEAAADWLAAARAHLAATDALAALDERVRATLTAPDPTP